MESKLRRIIAAALACAWMLGAVPGAGAEILELPLDFEPAPKPQATYPTPYSEGEAWQHYEDPTITADYDGYSSDEWHTFFYIARVKIADGSQIRTAAANSFEKKGVAPAQTLARRMNAVVAANGDFYTGNSGRYVLRQGKVFRDYMAPGQDLLLIDEDGDFHIVLAEEHPEEMDKTAVNGKKITNALCFGPALIRDGEIVVDPSKAQEQSHPIAKEIRMAICQMGEREYMLVTNSNESLTLEEFAQFLSGFDGIQQAYNLDGGMSSHLVFMGELRNKFALINNQDYRPVPDIIYFASAYRPD